MTAIYRKELKQYFSISSTYLILTVQLLIIGIFVAVTGSAGGFHYVPAYQVIPQLLAVPLLQLLAAIRAQRNGVAALLFSLPVTPTGIYLGRYLAYLTVMLVPTATLALLPVCFSSLSNVSKSTAFTAVLGYFVFNALIGAIEQFLCSAFKKRTLAIAASFGASALLYIYHTLLSYLPFGDTAQSILMVLNPIGQFYAFTYGTFPISALITMLCGTVVFLFLGVVTLRRDKKELCHKQKRNVVTALTAICLIAALGISVTFALIPERMLNPDVSGSKTFLLSAKTKDYLKGLDEDVTIYLLSKGGKKTTDRDIQRFLYRFEGESEHVTVQFVNTETEAEWLAQYDAVGANDQSILVVSNRRYMLVNSDELYHYYNADLGVSLSPSQYAYYISAYLEYLQTQQMGNYTNQVLQYGAQLYSSTATVAYFDGDLCVTNAIHYAVSNDIPTVQIYQGSRNIDPTLSTYLINSGYFIEKITSLQSLSDKSDALIIYAPKSDLTEAERTALEQYLANGKNVLLFTDYQYPNLSNLLSVTEQYGMSMPSVKHLVCETASDYLLSAEEPYYFLSHVASCPITEDFSGHVVMLPAHSITVANVKPEGVTVTPLLYTSEEGYLMYEGGEEDKDSTAAYVCGAYAEKGESTLLWISSPDAISAMGYSLSGGGNFTVLKAALDHTTQNDYALLEIAPTLFQPLAANANSTVLTLLSLLFILVLPATALITGAVRIYLRKKR